LAAASPTVGQTTVQLNEKLQGKVMARFLLKTISHRPVVGQIKQQSVMAISVKSKFAGFLRGLLRQLDEREPARPVVAAAPSPVPAKAPATPPVLPTAPNSFVPPRSPANANEIELPLATVVAALPLDLRAKLMAAPPAGLNIRLQAETVVSQLAFGAVKISFGELRQLAPGIFANSGGELDNKLVSLPLGEILPRLNPALLARRVVKKVEVTAEITGPFADRGRGFSFTTQPLKTPAAPPPEPALPAAFNPPVTPRQVAPPPVTPQFPTRSITPAAPANGNGNGHSHPLPASPLTPRPGTSSMKGSNGGNGHGLALPPGLRLASATNGFNGLPPAAKISAAPAPAPAPAQPTIVALLGDLCENWPAELKDEILNSSLAKVSVPLDGAIILPGLKRGRVAMTWKQLRTLAQPSSAPSVKDALELELPLKVIAPLFLAAQKISTRPAAKAAVSAEIPDLFFGFPQPAAAPVAPAAPAAPVVSELPKPAEQKSLDTNYFTREEAGRAAATDTTTFRKAEVPQTDFMSRQAHPKEVVARAAALPGVAGAVVALQDGLRVASQTPAELNADTLAAFLPQIFERVNQTTRELRMGALNNVNFTVGNVPWKIFRVNSVYFAAFGRAGEPLPSAELAQLAAELDRKKQK
jgi:predicted regulator of Ras-like GTPase activity (Roadblock/LC7/MglB family)